MIYHFKGIRDCDSMCDIKVYRKRGQVFVFATELAGNMGTSITNWAEQLATQFCRENSISPHQLVWVEHYPARHRQVETYDQVVFDWNWYDGRFISSEWTRVEPEQVKKWIEGAKYDDQWN